MQDMIDFFNKERDLSSIGSNNSHFQKLTEIGKGAYGCIFKVKSLKDDNMYAMK